MATANTTTMATCSNPGCDQPGTNKCSACKTTPYCGSTCQTADWMHHKEECPGHLRKMGMSHLEKAEGFHRAYNWQQTLRHSELAANKLKQLKECPVEAISDALGWKFDALNFVDRKREALECAKEWYCLYPTNHTHPPAIKAGFAVIESSIHNREYWETITLSRDSYIPDNEREWFIAQSAFYLAKATQCLAENGDMPAEEKQEAGHEAIMLARRALEIHTRLRAESSEVGNAMASLATVLEYFNNVDDDEVLRLREQSIDIYARVQGSLSTNVAASEDNLGIAYSNRAIRARDADDLDRCVANLELALSRFREAARIYRAISQVDRADNAASRANATEKWLRKVTDERAAVTRG